MITFSIIIPVYNVEEYLEQCVNSCLAQTEQNYEIILVDDGSTDHSGIICDRFAGLNEKVSVIHQENGGLSAARNSGILKAAGDYLVFLDSDDYLDISALEHLSRSLEGHERDVIVNRVEKYDETDDCVYPCAYTLDENLFVSSSPTEIYKELLKQKKFTFTAWIFVVNRRFLLEKRLFFYPGLLHEDEMWTPYLMIKAGNIGCNNNHFYYYRVNRKNSIMSGINIEKAFSLVFIMNQLMADGGGTEYNETEKFILNYRASDIYLSLLYTINDYRGQGRFGELKERIKGKQKILLYRDGLRDRLIEKFISYLGLDCFLIVVNMKKIFINDLR